MVRYGFNDNQPLAVACSGICRGGGGGGRKSESFFSSFFAFQFFKGPSSEKMIFPIKKIAKYK